MQVKTTRFKGDYFLSKSELGDLLGLTEQMLYQLTKNQKLKTKKLGSQKYLPPQTVRQILEDRGAIYNTKIVSIQTRLGGVGKTTTAYHLAIRASMYGARVLCVDLDEQGFLTQFFKVAGPNIPVFYDVFKDKIQIEDAIIPVSQNISILGSHLANSGLDKTLSQDTKLNPATVIRTQLEPIMNDYDLIIIDCSPAFSYLNPCVALASDLVVTLVNPNPIASIALKHTINELYEAKKKFESDFSIKILFNKYDARDSISFEYLTSLYNQYERLFFKTFIRRTSGKMLALEEYDLLTREILAFPDLKKERVSGNSKVSNSKGGARNVPSKNSATRVFARSGGAGDLFGADSEIL